MFFRGLSCMIATGLMWVMLGCVTSYSAKRQIPQSLIQALAMTLVIVTGLCYCGGLPLVHGQLIGLLMSAGMLNYLAYIFLTKSMACLHNGLAWGIKQSAMLFPFLMGILFFSVAPTVVRLAGMFSILAALFLMTLDGLRSRPSGGVFRGCGVAGVLWGGASSLCAGFNQICSNLPSYLGDMGEMSSAERASWISVGGLVTYLLIDGWKLRRGCGLRSALVPGMVLGVVLVLVQYLFFFRGLDLLARSGAGSIGFPVAIGVCVGGFSLYSCVVLRERFRPLTVAALGLNLLGIILLSL